MKAEKYLEATKYMCYYNSFDGILVVPDTAVYKKGGSLDKADFDYHKFCSRKYFGIITELTEEAKKMNLSQINNILEKSKNLVSKAEVISEFYSDPNNLNGVMSGSDKKLLLVEAANKKVENLKKNCDISYLRFTILDDNLKMVKRQYYKIFVFNEEVYLIDALKERKRELELEIKKKRGKEKRIQRIKERKAEQRK